MVGLPAFPCSIPYLGGLHTWLLNPTTPILAGDNSSLQKDCPQNHRAKAWYSWTVELVHGEAGQSESSMSVLDTEKMGVLKRPLRHPPKKLKQRQKSDPIQGPGVPIINVVISKDVQKTNQILLWCHSTIQSRDTM